MRSMRNVFYEFVWEIKLYGNVLKYVKSYASSYEPQIKGRIGKLYPKTILSDKTTDKMVKI